jgi:hypothetical protein
VAAEEVRPQRRATDRWTDGALDVKFQHYDALLTALNPLPTEVARLATRMESLVTKDDLHAELDGITNRMDLNRRTLIGFGVAILVALIGAAATVVAASL